MELFSPWIDDVKEALEFVLDFIAEKRRILYGGMAIDLALKMVGNKGIYDYDQVIPDYDFYSPDFIGDSCHIVDVLGEKYDDVRAFTAIFPTTRTVRMYGLEEVADITYVGTVEYDKIPTLQVEFMGRKLLITHPSYQKIDQLNALAFPFDNVPMEVGLHRLEKDMSRFMLYEENLPAFGGKYTLESRKPDTYEQIKGDFHGNVICGMECYKFYYDFYSTVQEWLDIEPIKLVEPVESEIVLISTDINTSMNNIRNQLGDLIVEEYRPYTNKYPHHFIIISGKSRIDLLDIENKMIGYFLHEGLMYSTFPYLLRWLLYKKYYEYYDSILRLIYQFIFIYDAVDFDMKHKLISETPYFMPENFYYQYNIPTSVDIFIKRYNEEQIAPKSYYPGSERPMYVDNEYFNADGKLIEV